MKSLVRHRVSRGLSLVELMVAMAIGLVVVGAVFTNYLNNSVGARMNAAMSQVTSDAAIAMGILRNHIAMAGYNAPDQAGANGLVSTKLTGPALMGCDHGFTNITADADTISCASQPTPPAASPGDSLMVRYVVDTDSTPGTNQTPSLPTDCIGNGITLTGSDAVSDSRFVLQPEVASPATPPSLDCRGNGGRAALVENVVEMHLLYGLGDPDPSVAGKLLRIRRYVTASEVISSQTPASGTPPTAEEAWSRVMAVRICLIVRSADAVLTAPGNYLDCNQTPQTRANDRHIYRAFTSTVLLNNRLSAQSL